MLHVSHVYNMLLVHMFVIDIAIESLDQTAKPQLGTTMVWLSQHNISQSQWQHQNGEAQTPKAKGRPWTAPSLALFLRGKPSIKRPSGRKSYTNAYRPIGSRTESFAKGYFLFNLVPNREATEWTEVDFLSCLEADHTELSSINRISRWNY